MTTPILFIDRDGTLIEEPDDFQVDAYDKLRFVAGVVPALLRLREAGYEFVIVSNQDGLGTRRFPREAFDGPQRLMLQLFESQGIRFREVLVDTSLPEENSTHRKPGIGMLLPYLRDRGVDWQRSAVVGRPEGDGNEAIVAFVELRPGAALDAPALQAHLRGLLAPYKRPARIVAVPELPTNNNGKVLKRVLQEQAVAL